MKTSRTIIVLASNSWFTPWWMARQQLMSRLAKRGWSIAYSAGSFDVGATGWRDLVKKPAMDRAIDVDGMEPGSIKVIEPGLATARWHRFPRLDRSAIRRHIRTLFKEAGVEKGDEYILFVTHPKFWPYVSDLNPRHMVFYIHDSYDKAPGWREEWRTYGDSLARTAERVVSVAPAMVRRMSMPSDKPVHLLPHAVDTRAFDAARESDCPRDLSSIPQPRIGYVGRINLKLDLLTLCALVESHQSWHWVFIGAVNEGAFRNDEEGQRALRVLRSSANVHFLGVREFTDIPSYMVNMDVNIIPFRIGGDTGSGYAEDAFPTKLYEYLAAGRPIVSSDLESVREYSDVIGMAKSADDWESELTAAIHGGGVGNYEARRAAADGNTWDDRTDILEQWLLEQLGNK